MIIMKHESHDTTNHKWWVKFETKNLGFKKSIMISVPVKLLPGSNNTHFSWCFDPQLSELAEHPVYLTHFFFFFFFFFYLTHWGREKWLPFSRHFQMNFLDWKCMNFYLKFHWSLFLSVSRPQWVNTWLQLADNYKIRQETWDLVYIILEVLQ